MGSREDTVGEHDTVRSSSAEWLDGIAEWTEGLLVAGRYRIERFIGQGGMGKVYLARDEMLERQIALKRIPQEILFDADARDDLRQEANRLLDLAHDNIVRIHTYYDGPTWPFIAMEYLQGPTLKQLLRARKQDGRTFTVAEALAIASQVAAGLSYAHSKGVIHRDLKPGNLMLAEPPGEVIDKNVVVKITDFGISRVVADGTLRQTGKRTGTLPYMSPEQYRGEISTAKSDVYSLACSIYEFLSGRPPFYTGDIGYQIISMAPRPLSGVNRSVNNAILRGLAKDPKNRYDSVDHFLQALEGKISVSRPPIHRERFYRPLKFAAACVVVGLVFLLGTLYQGWNEPASPRGGALVTPRASERPVAPDITGRQAEEEYQGFRKRLLSRLESQIPSVIGRDASTMGPTISVTFTLPAPTESAYLRQLHEQLTFECYSLDADPEPLPVKPNQSVGERTFVIPNLIDGRYGLQPYVPQQPSSPKSKPAPMFPSAPLTFQVDLTPPRVEVKVVQAGLLLETQDELLVDDEEPVEWLTFAEAIDLGLEATEDISSASYQKVVAEGTSPWQIIVDPKRFRLPLAEGKNAFKVTASDRAGNPSHEVAIVLRRLQLGVKSFGLDGPVRGDLASVRGHLLVEGPSSPELRYFVNGFPAPAEGSSLVPLVGETGAVAAMEFTANLRLPEPTNNKIEVRYALTKGAVQTFSHPAAVRIDGVNVQPPELRWAQEIPKYTRENTLKLSGEVDPYFTGLTLSIQTLKRGTHLVDLVPNTVGGTATFVQEIELTPNQEHAFRVSFFYKEHPLLPAPPIVRVVSDQRPPTLVESPEFAADGDGFLMMTMRPSEELRLLRVLDRGAYMQVNPGFLDSVYIHTMQVPRKPITLSIEMEDLAGNPNTVEAICTFTEAELARATFRGGEADVTEAVVQGEAPRPVVRTGSAEGIDLRSRFLARYDLSFSSFNPGRRIEMGTTEITERVWAKFLESAGLSIPDATNPELPHLFSKKDTELLDAFVLWFEEQAKDGFTYRIPTTGQWLCAFVGATTDPEFAPQYIDEWFDGGRRDGVGFNPAPARPYGTNEPTTVRSRPENRTPTELYDMEANVRELVREGSSWRVIGGHNGLKTREDFKAHCKKSDPFPPEGTGVPVGLRILRKPIGEQ